MPHDMALRSHISSSPTTKNFPGDWVLSLNSNNPSKSADWEIMENPGMNDYIFSWKKVYVQYIYSDAMD